MPYLCGIRLRQRNPSSPSWLDWGLGRRQTGLTATLLIPECSRRRACSKRRAYNKRPPSRRQAPSRRRVRSRCLPKQELHRRRRLHGLASRPPVRWARRRGRRLPQPRRRRVNRRQCSRVRPSRRLVPRRPPDVRRGCRALPSRLRPSRPRPRRHPGRRPGRKRGCQRRRRPGFRLSSRCRRRYKHSRTLRLRRIQQFRLCPKQRHPMGNRQRSQRWVSLGGPVRHDSGCRGSTRGR